jgi:hypothetical protein
LAVIAAVGDAGKFNFAAHEREVTQGARHLNEIDIESFVFVVASVFGGEEYDLRYVVTWNGDSDPPRLGQWCDRKHGQ